MIVPLLHSRSYLTWKCFTFSNPIYFQSTMKFSALSLLIEQPRTMTKFLFGSSLLVGFLVEKASAGLVYSYDFSGDLTDSLGNGPDLVSEGGVVVATTQEFKFDDNGGLTLSGFNAALASHYTIEMRVMFDTLFATQGSSWIKLIDFKNLGDDNGLYSYATGSSAEMQFYPFTNVDTQDAFSPGTYTTVVITRNADTEEVSVYADGEGFSFEVSDTPGDTIFDGPMRFVQDDSTTGFREAASGSIGYVRIYDEVLTPEEIRNAFLPSNSVCENFAVHARTTVTFDGVGSTIHDGDINVSPGTSITGAYYIDDGNGEKHSSDFAKSVLDAHTAAMNVSETETTHMEIEMGDLRFVPGNYRSDSAINIAANTVVTLDGDGKYLFIAGSSLVTAAGTHFILKNGARAENVLWALGTTAILGADSSLDGTILAGTAITFGIKSKLKGCALAQSAVTFEGEGTVDLNHYEADNTGNTQSGNLRG
jgi:hypothetical protein